MPASDMRMALIAGRPDRSNDYRATWNNVYDAPMSSPKFWLLLNTHNDEAEFMIECQQCGAIATKAIDEVWRLGFVNCECGLEIAILDSTFQALDMQAIEIQAKLRRLMSSH
jgi:hypothetical protein